MLTCLGILPCAARPPWRAAPRERTGQCQQGPLKLFGVVIITDSPTPTHCQLRLGPGVRNDPKGKLVAYPGSAGHRKTLP